MRVGMVTLQAAEHLTPFRQGHGSSLCGIYSILNAYQLVTWPETKLTQGKLTSLISYAANAVQTPISDVLGYGMDEDTWMALCVSIVEQANAITGTSVFSKFILGGKAGRSSKKALIAIKKEIDRGRPALLMLSGNYSHTTVISGYTEDRLILFDSSGFKWIAAANVGLEHNWSVKLHRISAKSALALVAEDL